MIFESLAAGSALRMVWGELSTFVSNWQENKLELARIAAQSDADDRAHTNRMEVARFEQEKGVQMIRVQSELNLAALSGDLEKSAADTWGQAVLGAMKPVGVWFVDAWNAAIRPAAATLSLYLWAQAIAANNWKLTESDWSIICVILGFFFADRTMGKKGK